MASIMIVRKTTGGFTTVVFLIDTWGVGVKDTFVYKGLSQIWGCQHRFRVLGEDMRCLKILPAPLDEPYISRFGTKDGSL